jgi:hypothetical protein
MHKPTFRNYHKQKYTLLSKIAAEITQWTATHNTQKFRQIPWKTPTREREKYYSASRKVHYSSKTTFPTKRNTSQRQNCPTEIYLIFRTKTVLVYSLLRTSIFVPTVSCIDCSARPRNSQQNSKIYLKNRAQNASTFMPNPYRLYGSVQYSLPQHKI